MRHGWLWLAAMGCAGDKTTTDTGATDSSDADTDTDADTDVDTDTDTDADTDVGCTALTDGRWDAGGAAFGMTMAMTVTMDVTGCSFTITDWDMQMGVMPDGGSVAGDQVTLSGSAYWDTCTGTAATDGTSVAGVCSDDGAAFTLDAQ